MGLLVHASLSIAQITYYSRAGGTQDWDNPNSWTLSSDGIGAPAGPPLEDDYVIILNGHTILVDAITDNGGTGTSANSLDLPNVGRGPSYPANFAFPDSGTPNFFHRGEMTVEEGGTLNFTTRVMFDGTIFIAGTLTTTRDIIILGNLYFAPTASFSSTDDLICSGNSNTRIDIPNVADSWTSDDIYLDHTDAFVCGLGILNIGYFGGSTHIINLNNGADYDQICSNLTIVGCDNPALCVGTGTFNPSQATITGAGGTINYVENDVLAIDNSIDISYPEPLPYLTAATVSVSGGSYVNGEDVLSLPGISTIVAIFDTGSGTLNLQGYGNVSRWETALRSITYENLSENPTTATRTISFQVYDGFNYSNTVSRDITIQRVNDPPDVSTISGTPTPLAYSEGVGAIAIDDQIEVADADDVNLDGATVSLSNYVQGEDILAFVDVFGLTHSFDAPSGVLTITGSTSVINYQAALRTVTYENLSETPNLTSRTASFIVTDGDAPSPAFGRDINISATNDAPVNTVPGAQNVTEDAILTFAGNISIADADAGADDLTITLSVTDGILNFSSVAGLTAVTDNAASIAGTGTLAEINAALSGLTYTPTVNYSGGDILVVNTSDNGNNGSGGVLADMDNITITVDPINDAPVNTVPGAQSVDEDAVLTFSGNISIDDADAGTDDLTINLSVSNGVLNFSTTAGLTTVTDNSATITATGTLSAMNTALNGLTYTPTANYSGSDMLVVNTSDNGNNGSGGVQSDIDNITITVNPTNNDAPVNTVPAAQNVDEDAFLTFSGNISIDDSDAGTDDLTITLSVTNGILDFSATTGLIAITDNAATISATGTLTEINAALNGLTYTPLANYSGGDLLVVTTSDNGNNGSGGVQTDIDNITITVDPINDAPINAVPGAQNVDEDAVLTFSGNISIADIDAGSDDLTITLSVSNGVLDFSTTAGLTSVTDNSATITGTGTLTEINTALNGLTFTPTASYSGGDILVVNTSDNGNNGSGGILADIDNIAITVNPINDTPVNTVPGAQNVDEDAVLTFAGNISIDDADAGGNDLTITLGVTNGILNFSTTTGLTAVTDNAATITGTGTLTEINAALNGLTYIPTANYSGGDMLAVNTSDNGNNGSGGVQTDIDNITITVDPINDAPINTVPGAQNVDEDAILTFSGNISIDDVDAGSDDLTITLDVTNGILNFSTSTGLTTVTNNAATITGTGTLVEINTALNGLTYTPTANFSGSDILVVNTSDKGNNGSGGILADIDNIAITVVPINDLPVATDQSLATDEDVALAIDLSALVTDADNALDLTSIAIVTNPTNGAITNISTTTGVVTYTPNLNYNGGDSFTYTIADVSGGTSNIGTITITVNSINDLPVATDQSVTTDEDLALDIDLSTLVSDADNALDLASIAIVANPTNGAITNINTTTGVVTYTPNLNYNGGDNFTYTIADVVGGTSNIGTITITVNALNDLPLLSGTAGALLYNEGDGAVIFDNGITVGDDDNANLESATITISNNFQSAEDELGFINQNGINGNYSAGVLALSGSATLANYQAALRSITYENTSNTPDPSTRTIAIIVEDGTDASLEFSRDIQVVPQNNAPECVGTTANLIYTEGDGAVVLDDGLTISDPDNTTLASATVSISSNFQSTEDVLGFTNQSGITGSYSAGVLTLSGTANMADYQSALRSITYENSSETPNAATREVSIIINDGIVNSLAFNRSIEVNPINDLPVISGTTSALDYTEGDGPVPIEPGIFITDIDDINLVSATISLSSNYTNPEDVLAFVDQFGITGSYNAGILSLTGNANWAVYQAAMRTITYENTSIAPETASRVLNIVVNDGKDNSLAYTRAINITAIAEPSVITIGGGGTTLEIDYTEGEGQRQLDNTLQISDPDDINLEGALIGIESNYAEGEDVLSFTAQGGVSGVFSVANGILTIAGTASLTEYIGILQSVTYENTSDNPSVTSRSISLRVDDGDAFGDPVTFIVNIIPVNDAPLIGGTRASLVYPESSGPVQIDNSIALTDPDNPALQGATIRFINNYAAIEDVLAFTNQAGIAGQFDATSGSLTLSGEATLEDYQNALRSITYENTNERADLNSRTIEFIITDGDLGSDPYQIEILIEEVVDPVIVYQVVTPDGDSMNDSWVIDGIEQYPSNTVNIFDRFNSLVYTKNGYENTAAPWTGNANAGIGNGQLPDGTYFYTVDLGDGSKLYEGFLVLKSK